jgi:hypothetical protein
MRTALSPGWRNFARTAEKRVMAVSTGRPSGQYPRTRAIFADPANEDDRGTWRSMRGMM